MDLVDNFVLGAAWPVAQISSALIAGWSAPGHFQAPIPPAEPLTRRISLLPDDVANIWPVQDQGDSMECVAYATVACLELTRYTPGSGFQSLSPDFLYYAIRCLIPTPNPLPGGWGQGLVMFVNARDALAQFGICADKDWTGPGATALASATTAAAGDKVTSVIVPPGFPICEMSGSDRVWRLYRELVAGRPVGAAFHGFKTGNGSINWYDTNDGTVRFGGNDCPHVGGAPPYKGGHAVCIVGFEPDASDNMGGYFIFRNSLGESWPEKPIDRWPKGYGRIAASDVGRFLWEALFMPAA